MRVVGWVRDLYGWGLMCLKLWLSLAARVVVHGMRGYLIAGRLAVVRVHGRVELLVVRYQLSHDFHEILSARLFGAVCILVLGEVCYFYQPHC